MMVRKLFKTRADWRRWLSRNHHTEREIWLVYYKKHTGKKSVVYEEAVQEALCYGWIDSTVKRLDEARYMQKYTPRKESSNWSETNKNRAAMLITDGRMTRFGMKKIEAARENGSWNRPPETGNKQKVPKELRVALSRNKTAKKNFDGFAESYRNQYLCWLNSAKTEKTRQKRIALIVERSEKNIKPGML
jgi:uncharacterized protein YdeI (YjbR/CyaY-like superfamily)